LRQWHGGRAVRALALGWGTANVGRSSAPGRGARRSAHGAWGGFAEGLAVSRFAL